MKQISMEKYSTKGLNLRPLHDPVKILLRNAVDNYYDMQDNRLTAGTRLYTSYVAVHGEDEVRKRIECHVLISDKHKADKRGISLEEYYELKKKKTVTDDGAFTKCIYKEFMLINKIADKIEKRNSIQIVLDTYSGELGIIKTIDDYNMVQVFATLYKQETVLADVISKLVVQHPMWSAFFESIRGCGPVMAGVCIAYFDPHEARHVSNFWSYAGVGFIKDDDGEYRPQSKRYTKEVEYVDKKTGEIKTKKSIGYSPKLQSKLLNVFVGNVIKQGKGSKYWNCYYDFKNFYLQKDRAEFIRKQRSGEIPADGEFKENKLHCHRRASRKVVKEFLRDMWVEWRTLEGYELTTPYEVQMLGNEPHKYNESHAKKAYMAHGIIDQLPKTSIWDDEEDTELVEHESIISEEFLNAAYEREKNRIRGEMDALSKKNIKEFENNEEE